MNAAMLIYMAEVRKSCKGLLRIFIPIAILSSFCFVLVPSQSAVYLMASAHVAQDIIQQPETKEISSKILKVLNQKLDVEIFESKGKSK